MMQITRFKIQHVPVTFLIVVGVLLCVFIHSDIAAYHKATYTDSAHGNTSYGVKRSDAPADEVRYHRGSCAHCHDTFDQSICGVNELMLFAPMNPTSQTDNFCFKCHQGADSVQVGGLTNNDYGSEFGGGTANFTNIKDAFASGYMNDDPEQDGSSHNLKYVRNRTKSYALGDWITADTNACLVCHDVHRSQKNHDPYPGFPPYKTAVRRADDPSSGRGMPGNLWGDELNSDAGKEILNEWTVEYYQAPLRADSGYEPAGDSTQDGSNLPNFAWFCYNCHRGEVTSGWTDANLGNRGGYGLFAINWIYNNSSNDQHGAWHSEGNGMGGDEGDVIAPYTSNYNHVLSCTDCHEPHGSPNPFLLRTCVNGKDGITVPIEEWENDWGHLYLYDFCSACHVIYTRDSSPPAAFYHSWFTTEQAPDIDCFQNTGCHGHAGAF